MAAIPEPPEPGPTAKAIFAAYEARQEKRRPRRLGASTIGHPCARKIWFAFRWSGGEEFGGRMLRLFNTGHREETRIVADLRAIGCEVWDVDGSGGQWTYTAVGGHVVDKLDAVAVGFPEAPKTPHVCEFKTHNAKSFKELQKKGVREAKPEHFAQLVMGMALAKIPRGIYIAVNKDTDDIHTERLRWEDVKGQAQSLLEFAEKIVRADRAPAKISDDPEDFRCKYCPFHGLCHGSKPPAPSVPADITCRSCVHATAVVEDAGLGRWTCARHKRNLGEKEQEKACPDHLFIPDFVNFATVVDGGYDAAGDWIEYRNTDGAVWRSGKRPGEYRSEDLIQLPSPLVGPTSGGNIVHEVKAALGALVVGVEND